MQSFYLTWYYGGWLGEGNWGGGCCRNRSDDNLNEIKKVATKRIKMAWWTMGREPQERGGVPSEALASDMGNRVGGALRHGGFWRKDNQGVTDKKASRLSPVHIPVYKALYHVYFATLHLIMGCTSRPCLIYIHILNIWYVKCLLSILRSTGGEVRGESFWMIRQKHKW